jgi:hypothetical protein
VFYNLLSFSIILLPFFFFFFFLFFHFHFFLFLFPFFFFFPLGFFAFSLFPLNFFYLFLFPIFFFFLRVSLISKFVFVTAVPQYNTTTTLTAKPADATQVLSFIKFIYTLFCFLFCCFVVFFLLARILFH